MVLFSLCQQVFLQTLNVKKEEKLIVEAVSNKPLVGFKILVAEDYEINQAVMMSMLGNLGAEVELADDGLQVLNALDKQRYDVILMDCHMPNMDGYQLTKAILQLDKNTQQHSFIDYFIND